MNGKDKIFVKLGGKPVLAWSVEAFQKCASVDRIVLVVREENVAKVRNMAIVQKWTKVASVCAGGERRQDSVANGLAETGKCDWVVIHDGARPFVTADLIERGLEAAKDTGGAIAAVPVTDTIKIAGDDLVIKETPSRKNLWAAQTPQVFRVDIISEAYGRKMRGEFTDDAAMVEKLGYKVKLFTGSYDNIKITTKKDMIVAKVLAKR